MVVRLFDYIFFGSWVDDRFPGTVSDGCLMNKNGVGIRSGSGEFRESPNLDQAWKIELTLWCVEDH